MYSSKFVEMNWNQSQAQKLRFSVEKNGENRPTLKPNQTEILIDDPPSIFFQ